MEHIYPMENLLQQQSIIKGNVWHTCGVFIAPWEWNANYCLLVKGENKMLVNDNCDALWWMFVFWLKQKRCCCNKHDLVCFCVVNPQTFKDKKYENNTDIMIIWITMRVNICRQLLFKFQSCYCCIICPFLKCNYLST